MDTLHGPGNGHSTAQQTLDIDEIMALLPHRYPFLLIDRIAEVDRGKRIVAIKNVTINEQFFLGHFPGYPIMPGVLVVEAMAQAGGVLVLLDIPDPANKLMLFTGVDGAKFRQPVRPGDQLRLEVTILQTRSRAVRLEGKAYVDGKLACEAMLSCALVPRKQVNKAESKPATDPAGTQEGQPASRSAAHPTVEETPVTRELIAATAE